MITITDNHQILVLRPPKPSDWKKLWLFINTLSREQTFISYQGEKISQSQEKKYLQNKLKDIKKHKSLQLLLIHQQTVAGSADIDLQDRAENHVGTIGISLLPDFRHRGLGSKLMSHLLESAKKHLPDLKIATLNVMETNTQAIKLYTSFGFKESGRLPQGIRHKHKYVANIQMYKLID